MTTGDDAFNKMGASLDRFQEAHFWNHTLEQFYHDADPFRWHLNAFLRSLKEVPQLLNMELQNKKGFSTWFRDHRERLKVDPLVSVLSKRRTSLSTRACLFPIAMAQ